MADLGEAVLRLTVDDTALRQGLNDAKRLVEQEVGGATERGARRGTQRQAPQRISRQRAENIGARIQADRTLLQLRESLNKLEFEGVNVDQLRTKLLDARNKAAQGLFGTFKRSTELLKNEILDERTKLNLQKQQNAERNKAAQAGRGTGPSSPIRGAAFIPGSPIALEKIASAERKLAAERDRTARATEKARASERKRAGEQRRDIISNVAIGAGFPLLFGQGIGAAGGGAIGGGLGALFGGTAGFAGSIVGTAVGAAFDTALQKGLELAKGLEDPIKNFEALRQAAVLSSRAVEKNAEALIAAGREEEAAALIRGDLLRTFGSTEALKEYQAATDELNRTWTQAGIALTQFVAGPLAEFLRAITVGLGGGPVRGAIEDTQRAQELIQSSPQRRQQFERLAAQRGLRFTDSNLTVNSADLQKRVEVVREFLALNGQLTAEQRKQKQQVEDTAAGAERTRQANQLNLDIVEATARGNRVQALELERRLAVLQETRRLAALGTDADPIARDIIRTETAEKLRSIDEKRAALQQEINRELFTEQQTRTRLERSVSNTQALIAAQPGLYRDTLRSIQQVTASIEEARAKEAELGFQIGQARIGGREEEANQLVRQQQIAATETRAKLAEGALALKEAGESIRKNIEDATASLQNLRLTNLRFLSPREQASVRQQIEEDFQAAAERRGFTPRIRGRGTRALQEKQSFIEFERQERQLTKSIADGNAALTQINSELATRFDALTQTNVTLAEATNALASKNWTVDINVINQAGGASTVNAINGLAQ